MGSTDTNHDTNYNQYEHVWLAAHTKERRVKPIPIACGGNSKIRNLSGAAIKGDYTTIEEKKEKKKETRTREEGEEKDRRKKKEGEKKKEKTRAEMRTITCETV